MYFNQFGYFDQPDFFEEEDIVNNPFRQIVNQKNIPHQDVDKYLNIQRNQLFESDTQDKSTQDQSISQISSQKFDALREYMNAHKYPKGLHLAKVIQMIDSIKKEFHQKVKKSSDPAKNFPRQKSRYIAQIIYQKHNQSYLVAIKSIKDQQKRIALENLFKDILKKGCWQKDFKKLIKQSCFQLLSIILEVINSEDVYKMMEDSRKDESVKQIYKQLYKKDSETYQKIITDRIAQLQKQREKESESD